MDEVVVKLAVAAAPIAKASKKQRWDQYVQIHSLLDCLLLFQGKSRNGRLCQSRAFDQRSGINAQQIA